MKRIIIPIALLAHSFANLIYYIDWKSHWLSEVWYTYFFCVQAFFLSTFCMIFASINRKSLFDKHFLFIEAFYNMTLCFAYELNYKGVLKHTYGLSITCISIIGCTLVILISGLRHGYFKY